MIESSLERYPVAPRTCSLLREIRKAKDKHPINLELVDPGPPLAPNKVPYIHQSLHVCVDGPVPGRLPGVSCTAGGISHMPSNDGIGPPSRRSVIPVCLRPTVQPRRPLRETNHGVSRVVSHPQCAPRATLYSTPYPRNSLSDV